ncbi:MAG: DHH family phosphoesterase [Gemmatimonadetes bacterium]|nr:DHH family phosphoesterase [Gemmatimonadota bacterium]
MQVAVLRHVAGELRERLGFRGVAMTDRLAGITATTGGTAGGTAGSAAVEALREADEVALACHVGPDGDALGSMLALGAALRSLGKHVVASWGGEPFQVPEAYSFLPAVDLLVPPGQFPTAPRLFVTFDTGSADRLGSLADRVHASQCCLVVDHHASNTRYGGLHLIDVSAAATAVLVADLVDRDRPRRGVLSGGHRAAAPSCRRSGLVAGRS